MRLDGYQVLELLSRGRDLDVYAVWSDHRGCPCVAKVLRPDGPDPERARPRLLREGELAARFTHPHIVRAYEVRAEPEPAVILETITGATLAALTADRRLPWPDAAELGLHLCSAIHYLHGEGWLHADLKPSNVIAEAGRGKVIDLSLARAPGRCRGRLGTRGYAPPEQADGGELTAAVDVWGVGATLFAALAGRPPVDRGDGWEPAARPARIATVRRLPRTVSAPIDACLEARPEDRPTVGELADALESALT